MSDERLRELERRWRETGDVEDEAAWLRERVRAGDLSHERLELAALLGHAAAGPPPAGDVEGSSWPERLARWGHEVQARCWIASGWHALGPTAARPECVAAMHAAERLLVAPGRHADWEAGRALFALQVSGFSEESMVRALAGYEGRPVLGPTPPHFRESYYTPGDSPLARVVEMVEEVIRAQGWDPGAEEVGLERAIQADLVPWALGYSDPVGSRVTKRGTIRLLPEGPAGRPPAP